MGILLTDHPNQGKLLGEWVGFTTPGSLNGTWDIMGIK